jgi:hypothetical protein
MVASVDTTKQVLAIIEKYIDPEDIPKLMDDLSKIPGNHSFVQTILRLKNAGDPKGLG